MNSQDKQPKLVDYDSQMPITHPVGTFETRPTKEGELGYDERLGAAALTAVDAPEDEAPRIGDTSRTNYPAVLSNPYDLDAHGNAIKVDDKEV